MKLNKYPSKNYSGIIRKMYLEILGREPDEAGFNYYLSLMEKNEFDEQKLRDTLRDSDEYKRIEFKNRFTKKYDMNKNFYGKVWVGQDNMWYSDMFDHVPLLHTNCIEFLKRKTDVKTVLEIGCGTGIYPIRFKNLFSGKKYVGMDISESAISFCKKNSEFDFFCGDFLKMELNDQYDLVFSNAVIDHVYDIDLFLSKLIKLVRKYAYVSAYLGFFPDLLEHEVKYIEEEGYYLNKLSIKKVKEILIRNGLGKDEFVIKPQEGGHKDIKYETVIEIDKKNFK